MKIYLTGNSLCLTGTPRQIQRWLSQYPKDALLTQVLKWNLH